MKIKAPLKINLGLNVFEKKQNFTKHQIYSLMVKTNVLYDEIEIKINNHLSAHKIQYYINNKMIFIQNCIIHKCIEYLSNFFKIQNKYSIIVKKNIPIGSGLGGGSSDGAAIIKAICKLEQIDIKQLDLLSIALNIGSDIPFFLTPYQSAIVKNYGDEIFPFNLPRNLKITINIIHVLISTSLVFKEFDILNKKRDNINDYESFVNSINNHKEIKLTNDLQESCLKLQPIINKYWTQLEKKHDYLTLSGSGATIIGLDYKKG